MEQSTQLHTNPSQPPVHSRLLPRPPHCRTGPLPLCDSPGLHCTQAPTYPSAVPISLSPPSSKAQASRVRLFGLPTTLLLLASPIDRVLSSCTIFPLFFSLHTHSALPPIITRPTLYYCPPALRLKPCRRLSSSVSLAAASFNLYTLLSRQRGWSWCSPPEDRGTWYQTEPRPTIHHITLTTTTATSTALTAREPKLPRDIDCWTERAVTQTIHRSPRWRSRPQLPLRKRLRRRVAPRLYPLPPTLTDILD